jgi:hypothetical protein
VICCEWTPLSQAWHPTDKKGMLGASITHVKLPFQSAVTLRSGSSPVLTGSTCRILHSKRLGNGDATRLLHPPRCRSTRNPDWRRSLSVDSPMPHWPHAAIAASVGRRFRPKIDAERRSKGVRFAVPGSERPRQECGVHYWPHKSGIIIF